MSIVSIVRVLVSTPVGDCLRGVENCLRGLGLSNKNKDKADIYKQSNTLKQDIR